MNIQWYPGHMTKARRMMQENIKLIDLIIELVDARAPLASRNPDIDELGKGKARLILLNKADLASDCWNQAWEAWFKAKGYFVVQLDSRGRTGMKTVQNVIKEACKEKTERDRRRGILNRPVRAMVAGIPNVGKSTFINSFAGRACTKTGNKPGVTKGAQWIRLNRQVELLDTPGILWPRFDDQEAGIRLAFLGSVNDEILNLQELAGRLGCFLQKYFPPCLEERYKTEFPENPEERELLTKIAQARSCLTKGGEPDIGRAAVFLLDDFRSGRLGKITLEFPPEGEYDKSMDSMR
ncbi:MAG: ribosome biogenesis GTPase YlqF [Lachnospiraceae bacterium]|jgi:ribosome biogenesis GTPase A|nr:ribosome biogenesis GTPase YlqF [Lachnospiraceae bacterium]MCI9601651.1 ribosome biogenesis GTPase YlqF [Lachnospiraceae bacterium]